MTRKLPTIALIFFVSFGAACFAQDSVDFNRDVKPILAENCFACHGLDEGSREAGLRLDTREESIDAGAIVPGDADQSSLIERIFSEDEDFVMPPPESHSKLSEQDKEILKRWINEGAVYQQHWSLIAPVKAEPPATRDQTWVRNEIDRFVLAKLNTAGLTPNAEADPATLFRRLSLDINGLPPRPEDLAEFIAEHRQSPQAAVSNWIDRLMERPSWGEHRARYWLDAARYADTHGMHFDNYREMWPYRDWVIRSFNANQRFDQFTIEQLAGDLLENPTTDQLVATGFQRCGMTTNEGGTIDEENLSLYAADRVQTFGWVYLGLTTNCCQCHDHKFDPISAKDYYSLAAFFRNTTQPAKDGNSKDGGGPVITVPTEEDAQRWQQLPAEIAKAESALAARRLVAAAEFEDWLQTDAAKLARSLSDHELLVHLPLNDGEGRQPKVAGGSEAANLKPTVISARAVADSKVSTDKNGAPAKKAWVAEGVIGPALKVGKTDFVEVGDVGSFATNQPFTIGCWVQTPRQQQGSFVARMDPQQGYRGWDFGQSGGEFACHLLDQWPNNGLRISTQGGLVKVGQWQHVVLTWDGSGKAEGVRMFVDGKQARTKVSTNTIAETADIAVDTLLRIGSRAGGDHPFEGMVQELVIYNRQLALREISALALHSKAQAAISTPLAERTEEMQEALTQYFFEQIDTPSIATRERLSGLKSEQQTLMQRSPVTHIQKEKPTPAMAHILMRGEYDNLGEEVAAAPPAALHPMPAGAPANRMGLANWVVDPANPLTARVTVNRFWQELFGQGIVTTPEDFGVMGAPPSNQELLDWLAVDFQESGWDVKRMYKQIMMSATYRQSAAISPEKLEKDPENRLLARGPRFRMDAEMIRDQALAVSGLLSEKMYGPGVKPYQPENLWEIVGLPGGDTRQYVQDTGENVYRRSVYSFWKRMSPPPNLEAFNAPNREVCTVRRERTNTPLQALVTLNDPQFVEAARALATAALIESQGLEPQALTFISQRTLCRELTDQESSVIVESLRVFLEHYQANPDEARALISVGQHEVDSTLEAAQLAAWTMVCSQLLNVDEALNK